MNAVPALTGWLLAMTLGAVQPATPWHDRIEALIRQLGDESFAKRDAATKALIAAGDKIVPLLDKARRNADLEVARRIDRIRYQVAGFLEELTAMLNDPVWNEVNATPRDRLALLLIESPDPLPGMVSFVAAHQPKSGDFLLKIIADQNHKLHRPATRLFCETCSSSSPQQLQTYLQTSFTLQAVYRARYPQGVDAYIETRYWHRYGATGWPKGLAWEIRITHALDGQPYGKRFDFAYPGAGAATGWINAGKLDQGRHMMRFDVDYAFTHQGRRHEHKIRSPEYTFAVGPAVLADDLLAPTDAALAKKIREALRMLDYEGQDGREKVLRPWQPQVTWEEPIGKPRGLHAPVWSVQEQLAVDLCFDVTIRDAETGKRYPGEPLMLHKGKTGRGVFMPRDVRGFCKDKGGFVMVEIDLQPSRSQALTDPAITSYFGWPIVSPTLKAKIIGEVGRLEIK